MINNISAQEIEKAVRTHWKLQLGSYFESIHDLNGAVYNLSGFVTDYYWNYAGMINVQPLEIDALIKRVIVFARKCNREPAFYVDPLQDQRRLQRTSLMRVFNLMMKKYGCFLMTSQLICLNGHLD